MKKLLITYLALFIAFTVSFAQTKESRKVDTFTKIAFRVPGKLYLKQGDVQKVELEGSREMLEKIETTVSGGRLSIGRESENWKLWNWDNEDRITVYVTVKDLEAISVSGSGDLIGESKFKTNDLDLNVSGSGSLVLEADANGLLGADVSGSGRIDFKGSCKDFDSKVSGSGKVSVELVATNKIEVAYRDQEKLLPKAVPKKSGQTLAALAKCSLPICKWTLAKCVFPDRAMWR